VPFRETIVAAAEMAPPKDPNLPRGTVVAITPSKQITVRVRTRPLPAAVTEFLVQNSVSIKSLYSSKRGKEAEAAAEEGEEDKATRAKLKLLELEELKQGLQKAFESAPSKERDVWAGVVDKITAFGPRRVGPNLLIDATQEGGFRRL
jgi:ribosome assembly protein 1